MMNRSFLRIAAAAFLAFRLVTAQSLSVGMGGTTAAGTSAMAATAHPLASQAAIEMLQRGGNAVDAAVAAAFAIGVVEPDGSGIGGGGGMLVYLAKERRSVFIDYYQRSSEDIVSVNYNPKTDNRSAKAVLVPGTVDGLLLALERWGTLPRTAVLAPAIRYAEEGFAVDQTLAKIFLDNSDLLQKYDGTAAVFLNDGFPYAEGDTLKQQELARTLRLIAEKGREGFYAGPVAESLVRTVSDLGGALTMNDLKNYRSDVVEPLRGSYRGYDVVSANAPQSGASVIEALQILENENIRSLGHPSRSAESLHLMAETMRRVYADRTAYIEDPNFTPVPNRGLTSKAFARARYHDINRAMAEPPSYRSTKAGNPHNYSAGADEEPGDERPSPASDRARTPSDEDDEGVSSYKKYGDDLFDAWSSGAKKTSPKKKSDAPPAEPKETDDDDAIPQEADAGGLTDGAARFAAAGEGGHTTHLCVVDKEGNAVSVTQTLGTFFGSGLTVEGVLLNTSMSNFSATAAVNSIQPNKRPRSSIAPTILLRGGRPAMVVGSPGAARIIATVVQVISNVVDHGMDAGAANTAPRFFCQKFDDFLYVESRVTDEAQQGVKRKGHPLRVLGDFDLFFGGVQLILIDPATGRLTGSADPRRGGAAVGY